MIFKKDTYSIFVENQMFDNLWGYLVKHVKYGNRVKINEKVMKSDRLRINLLIIKRVQCQKRLKSQINEKNNELKMIKSTN